MTGTSRAVTLIGALVAVGIALRLAFVATVAADLPVPGDAHAYHLLADGLASGAGYVRPYDRLDGVSIATAEYAPGHPAILALADLAGLDSTVAQRRLGAVLGGLTIALTGAAARRLGGLRAGVLAAGVVAVHPLVVGHDTTLLTEGLTASCAAAVILAGTFGARSKAAAVVLGALVGLAALVRADSLVLLATVAVPVALLARGHDGSVSRRTRRRAAVLVVISAALLLAPWVVRNAVRLGRPVGVSTNIATMVDGANCPDTYRGPLLGSWRFGPGCFEGYETGRLLEEGEAGAAAVHLDQGVEFATANAGRLPRVVLARLARTWGAWDVDQQAYLASLEGKVFEWERAGIVFGWLVTAAATAGLVVARRHGRLPLVLLAGPLVAVSLVSIASYGNVRFRAAAEPALAIGCGLAATGVRRRTDAA